MTNMERQNAYQTGAIDMNATQIQIEQANDSSFIAELYSAASDIVKDGEESVECALTVIELIEDGKLLEAVMIDLTF